MQFATDADVQQALTFWLQTLDTGFVCNGIQVLVPWWDKCWNVNGEHMWVWSTASATTIPCIHHTPQPE